MYISFPFSRFNFNLSMHEMIPCLCYHLYNSACDWCSPWYSCPIIRRWERWGRCTYTPKKIRYGSKVIGHRSWTFIRIFHMWPLIFWRLEKIVCIYLSFGIEDHLHLDIGWISEYKIFNPFAISCLSPKCKPVHGSYHQNSIACWSLLELCIAFLYFKRYSRIPEI